MQLKAIAKVNATGNLELPPEILAQLEPLSEYEILMTEEKIILEKKSLDILKPVRNHQAFLNGYVLEDEGLYSTFHVNEVQSSKLEAGGRGQGAGGNN